MNLLFEAQSIIRIAHAGVRNSECALVLRHVGTVIDFCDARLATTLLQHETCRRRVRQYVAADRLLRINL